MRSLRTLGTLALAGVLLLMAVPVSAQTERRFWLAAKGDNGTTITDGFCRVVNAGLNTQPTIYSDRTLATTATNPITLDATSGECSWYLDGATTAVDVIMAVTAGAYKGARIRVDNVRRDNAKTVMVGRSQSEKVAMIALPAAAAGTITATSYTVPAGALIKDAVVEVTTAVAASNLRVGSLDVGAYAGSIRLCSSVSTAAVGFVNCAPSALLHAASNAISINNDNHAVSGYVYIFYKELGNEP